MASSDNVLITFVLEDDQSKTLLELSELLDQQGFWSSFPPDGIEIVYWHVWMGVGQVVCLEVPPARLREVNVALEQTGWKVFRNKAYATYDISEVAMQRRRAAKARG